MKTIGLTGVMGAGKSSAIQIIKDMGIPVLDCDKINAQLLEKNEAGYLALIKVFDEILNEHDELDKAKLANQVFQDEKKKAKLESIMHPLIREEIQKRIKELNEEYVVVEVPLLFEIGWEDAFEEIWCVSAKLDTILKRLKKGRQISNEEAKRRLAYQMPQAEKEKRSDVVLYNDTTLEDLRKQIIQALSKE